MSDHLEADDRLDDVLRALADRVRMLRRGRGISLSDLAFESGLSESRLRGVESGRTAPSLATLLALAETFEIALADLFAHATDARDDGAGAEPLSPYVVPSEVVWGGELPPAPWVSASGGGTDDPTVPDVEHRSPSPDAAPVAPPFVPTEKVWGGPLPPAPWMTQPSLQADGVVAPPVVEPASEPLPPEPVPAPAALARRAATSAATRAHDYALAHGMRESSAYVFVAPGAATNAAPRTFSDLRTGALAGRDFRSLQEFAVASVVEGGYALADVARVFRIPSWRLDQWVRETGHTPR
ncbi:helix-turn-helix transcriptional regulator [Microbacterium testaceum]|uniref:helix-turn-helix domain-containing protein n=1 Tax=Microbacterium testaceum TaxID=2033 RepID=UPI003424A221